MDEYNSSKYDMNSFEFGMSNDRDTSGYFDQSCFDEVDSTNRSFSRSLHPENPYGPSKESLVNAPLHRMDQKLDSIFSFQMDTSYSQEQVSHSALIFFIFLISFFTRNSLIKMNSILHLNLLEQW